MMKPTPEISSTTALWQAAAVIASLAHLGQVSPGTSDPYVAHVLRVALLVSARFGCHDARVLAAALLHDVIEKTAITAEQIRSELDETVAEWVEWLSKNARGPESEYWQRLADAPWQVRLIKVADALDHLNGPKSQLGRRLETAAKAAALPSTDSELLRGAISLLEAEARRFGGRDAT